MGIACNLPHWHQAECDTYYLTSYYLSLQFVFTFRKECFKLLHAVLQSNTIVLLLY